MDLSNHKTPEPVSTKGKLKLTYREPFYDMAKGPQQAKWVEGAMQRLVDFDNEPTYMSHEFVDGCVIIMFEDHVEMYPLSNCIQVWIEPARENFTSTQRVMGN